MLVPTHTKFSKALYIPCSIQNIAVKFRLYYYVKFIDLKLFFLLHFFYCFLYKICWASKYGKWNIVNKVHDCCDEVVWSNMHGRWERSTTWWVFARTVRLTYEVEHFGAVCSPLPIYIKLERPALIPFANAPTAKHDQIPMHVENCQFDSRSIWNHRTLIQFIPYSLCFNDIIQVVYDNSDINGVTSAWYSLHHMQMSAASVLPAILLMKKVFNKGVLQSTSESQGSQWCTGKKAVLNNLRCMNHWWRTSELLHLKPNLIFTRNRCQINWTRDCGIVVTQLYWRKHLSLLQDQDGLKQSKNKSRCNIQGTDARPTSQNLLHKNVLLIILVYSPIECDLCSQKTFVATHTGFLALLKS